MGSLVFPLRWLWRVVTTLLGFGVWGLAIYGAVRLLNG